MCKISQELSGDFLRDHKYFKISNNGVRKKNANMNKKISREKENTEEII